MPRFITCPACGAPAWTQFCRWTHADEGDDIQCRCGLCIWQGQVVAGSGLDDEEGTTAAVRAAWPGAGSRSAWVAPEDREFRLAGTLGDRRG